jgi:capsular exopolysaccharide synthesis family protein
MSRIHDILNKAEREGTARRTRTFTDEGGTVPVSPGSEIPPPAAYSRAQYEPSSSASIGRPSMYTPLNDEELTPALSVDAQLQDQLVAALAPTSMAAEQYRSLRARLKRAENGRSVRTIVITSPAKGDGKSLTAANLALTMAQEFQQRVLLIDADLRQPTQHQLFGVPDGPGLADVLMGAAGLQQALVAIPDHHLTLLPAGVPPGHPAELLGSATMRRTLETLRTRFDRILIDMPPVAPLADLHVVAPLADGILMIVRAGMTPRPAIEQALSGLDVSKVLGLVLNDSGDHGSDKYEYQGYGYVAG